MKQESQNKQNNTFERFKQSDSLMGYFLSWEDRNKIEDNLFIKANFSLKTLKRISLVINMLYFIFIIAIIYQAFNLFKTICYVYNYRLTFGIYSSFFHLDELSYQYLNELMPFLLLFLIYIISFGIPLSIKQAIRELEKEAMSEKRKK